MPIVGQNVPRTDGFDKVTGKACFVDDLSFPDMLHGATIRSGEPHAKLDGIVWGDDVDWSDLVRVDASDIAGKNSVYLMIEDQPALVDSVIRHCDEPVALVAGPTRRAVLEARKSVSLQTTPAAPVFDMHDSLRADAPIFGEDNVFKRIDIKKGDSKAALDTAPHVIESTFRTSHQEQMYIEPQGVIAVPERGGGVTIYGSLQCPYYVQKALCPLLELPPEKVRVVQCVTGGGFGGKEEYPSMLSAHAALLALKAQRPVKIVYDRAEDIAATTKRHPTEITHRTGFDDDGQLLAMEIEILMDSGAYCTLSPVVLSRAAIHGAGPYRCDNITINALALATHTPPNGAFRGFGAPQAAFAVERQMDRIAAKLGLSPLEVRRRNLLALGDTTCTGQVLNHSVGSGECLETAVERSQYEKRWSALQTQPLGARLRKGVGVSCFLHGGGFTGNGEVRLAAKVDAALTEEGGVAVFSSSTDMGQGARTVFSQITADALGIPFELVRVPCPDTEQVPDSGPTVASRTTMVVGKVVEDAAVNLGELVKLELAAKLSLAPNAIELKSGDFVWADGTISFQEAATEIFARKGALRARAEFQDRDFLEWDDQSYSGDAYPAYSWAAVVTELEVDMDTYIPKVTRFVTAQDIGKAINPTLVAGQIEGGSLQGLGWASMEEVKMENGRFVNHHMTDCIIPTALDAPEMDVTIVEAPYRSGPHGAKGLGEMPMDLPAPAMAAAMEQATGVAIDATPFTPEMLCAALEEVSS